MNNQENSLILIQDLGRIYPTEKSKQKTRMGIYKCQCGNEFRTTFQSVSLNKTKSCGCLKGKMITDSKIKHGQTHTRLFKIWARIKVRCYNKTNPRYNDWGGRGIIVCDEWRDNFKIFQDWAFNNGYSDNLSIDRIDNDGNYEPNNCRWATKEVQARNTRKIWRSNTSGYRGVYVSKNKFKSLICVDKKPIYLGLFNTKLEAAQAYDNYVIINGLEHTLNFSKD